MTLRACLSVSGGVRAALQEGRPVVALESTIITHGLPRPINYETAVAAEEAVRKAGAEPATIALLDGQAHIGLSRSQLARIAEAKENVYKASRANLAQTLAQGKGHVGGTTVSGTMALAHLAGIRIFATGGIGGVHRGAESSMDISADLVELGRTPVAVFSSGAKSILDIPRTLEYLETQGVPVMSFHPSGEFPSFYSACSGLYVPSVRDALEAARIIAYNQALQLQNGLLFGVPIPAEFEQEGAAIQEAVERAVRESVEQGIDRQGKLATPWLLRRVAELAQQSVTNNIGLVLNNARVAAECAVALAKVSQSNVQPPPRMARKAICNALVVGCAAVDITAQRTSLPAVHSTAKGQVRFSLGGVAQNVASAAQTILADRASVLLAAPINPSDVLGKFAQAEMARRRLQSGALIHIRGRTATCNLLLNEHGDLETGVTDMEAVESSLTPDAMERIFCEHFSQNLRVVGVDANVLPHTLAKLAQLCNEKKIPLLFEPTSVAKSDRLVYALLDTPNRATFSTPNTLELAHMAQTLRGRGVHGKPIQAPQMLMHVLPLGAQALVDDASVLSHLVDIQLIKMGPLGVLVVRRCGVQTQVAYAPAHVLEASKSVNTTGAGDTFTGAVVAALCEMHTEAVPSMDQLFSLVDRGQAAAVCTLYSNEAVAPSFT